MPTLLAPVDIRYIGSSSPNRYPKFSPRYRYEIFTKKPIYWLFQYICYLICHALTWFLLLSSTWCQGQLWFGTEMSWEGCKPGTSEWANIYKTYAEKSPRGSSENYKDIARHPEHTSGILWTSHKIYLEVVLQLSHTFFRSQSLTVNLIGDRRFLAVMSGFNVRTYSKLISNS